MGANQGQESTGQGVKLGIGGKNSLLQQAQDVQRETEWKTGQMRRLLQVLYGETFCVFEGINQQFGFCS